MYQVAKHEVKRFMIQRTGTYQQQWRRPYLMDASKESLIQQLENAVATSYKINPQLTVDRDSQLIVPASKPEAAVGIINGWDTPRLKFYLEIALTTQIGRQQLIRVQGYTEYDDRSMNGQLDNSMRFFINQICQQELGFASGDVGGAFGGPATRVQTTAWNHVLHDPTLAQRGGITAREMNYSMAPDRIFQNMGNIELNRASAWDDDLLIDTTSMVSNQSIHAPRIYELPGEYASTVVNTFIAQKTIDPDERYVTNMDEFYNNCKHHVLSQQPKKDYFSEWLENNRGGMFAFSSGSDNSFTLDDLLKFDHTATHPDKFKQINDGFGDYSSSMDSANMGGADFENVFAVQIVTGLMGLMATYGLVRVVLDSNNVASVNGKPITTPHSIQNGLQLPCAAEANGLLTRFDSEVIYAATQCYNVKYVFTINCDFSNEAIIELNIEGRGLTRFVFPTFCDSLITPVMTNNKGNFDNITGNFSELGERLYDAARFKDGSVNMNANDNNTIRSFGGTQTDPFKPSQQPSQYQNNGFNDPFKTTI